MLSDGADDEPDLQEVNDGVVGDGNTEQTEKESPEHHGWLAVHIEHHEHRDREDEREYDHRYDAHIQINTAAMFVAMAFENAVNVAMETRKIDNETYDGDGGVFARQQDNRVTYD